MTLVVEVLQQRPIARRRIELVERKGFGHPDTLCDLLVEAISLALNRMYLERVGAIAHYNIDKALLVAGQTAKGFGWGEMKRPIELIVGDRATFTVDDMPLPIEETVRLAVDMWAATHLPHIRSGKDLRTRVVLGPGSEELRRIFKDCGGTFGANDTAGASGYWPLSPTEETVLAVEHHLNSAEFKRRFHDTGQDVKVLGVRYDETLALTVAMPFLCREIATESAYFQRKAKVLEALADHFRDAPFSLRWELNALDRPGRGSEGCYLALTGTSAEDADSGQVGRGNRANGLIAFSRPTGGEAAPGKNPVAHVGKIYSVLSHRLAQLIHAGCPALTEVYVHLSTRIGQPVDQPWTGVQVILPNGMELADVEPTIRDVVEAELKRLPEFQAELTRGEHPVC